MEFKPFVAAETLEACALIGPHLMAAGGEDGSSSSCGVFSPELGGIPGLSGPRYPLWKDDVSCSGSESTLGYEVYEHNSECWAVEVIGQDWSSEVVALFLEDFGAWASSFELPHGHGPSLPRHEGCMSGKLRVAGLSVFTVFAVLGRFSRRGAIGSRAWKVNSRSKRKPFSHRGLAVAEGRGMW